MSAFWNKVNHKSKSNMGNGLFYESIIDKEGKEKGKKWKESLQNPAFLLWVKSVKTGTTTYSGFTEIL